MGYVKVSKINQFLPPALFGKAGGTWTLGVSSNVVAETRSTDSSLRVPAHPGANQQPSAGRRIRDRITRLPKLLRTIFAPVLHKTAPPGKRGASGERSAPPDGHDSLMSAVGTHSMTISLESPCWLGEDECLWLQLSVDAAASTSFSLYGAQVNYDLNL